MAQVDAALAQWALDVAKRHGATAAEVLCVSAESLAAGVRLGEVEKLKSSRERRLGIRVFVGQSSANARRRSWSARGSRISSRTRLDWRG
jgi:PmbA protein